MVEMKLELNMALTFFKWTEILVLINNNVSSCFLNMYILSSKNGGTQKQNAVICTAPNPIFGST